MAVGVVWFQRGRGRHDVRAVLGEGPLRVRSSATTVEFADESKLRIRLDEGAEEDEFSTTIRRADDDLRAYVATLDVGGTVEPLLAGSHVTFKARCGSSIPYACAVARDARVRVTAQYAGVVADGRRGRYRNEWTVVSLV